MTDSAKPVNAQDPSEQGSSPAPPNICPDSHLPIELLKKIGKTVEQVGLTAVETAIVIALSGTGAFPQ